MITTKNLFLSVLSVILLSTGNTYGNSEPEPGYTGVKHLKHIVNLSFNKQATDSVIQAMTVDLLKLQKSIPAIRSLEWGVNINKDSIYTHCLIINVKDGAAFENYKEHPIHLKFVEKYGKYIERVKETQIYVPVMADRR